MEIHLGSYATTRTGNDDNLAGQRQLWLRRINRGIHILVDVLCELEAGSACVASVAVPVVIDNPKELRSHLVTKWSAGRFSMVAAV